MMRRGYIGICLLLLTFTGCASKSVDSSVSSDIRGLYRHLPKTQAKLSAERGVAQTNEQELSLENVFLGHANPVYWEPGDAKYYFPVPARIYYGYSPMQGYSIEVSENCKGRISIESKKAEAHSRENLFALYCTPNGSAKEIALTKSSRSYGSEAEEYDGILGTSFEFTSNVQLKKLAPKKYLLEVVIP